ncbi:protein of unknown function [Alkalibacterium putridalgicola]|uniref:Uncharacterized protein n=1 Tax=Alkalibacterium putridalgicola TaxID=426703 RepID=A0A1H7S9A9_9LACT|nr:DUF1413 domain-containing protein [Alkalibacterium putridalgicola]GEK89117.1 hypothetical protein APU01nite_11560 [Alkalibacterium putridalgicola]SEL69221.1 protein of unknown function [Alkalibacterium putridalgicola]
MDTSKISKDLQKDVRELILRERLHYFKESIKQGLVEDGFEFELKDLFIESEWDEVAVWPGNWTLGKTFASKVKNDLPYITRADDNKKGYAVYRFDKSKFEG